jgi:hypothetical protein
MESEARAFVDALTARIHPIATQYSLTYWNLATTGAPAHKQAFERLAAAYTPKREAW